MSSDGTAPRVLHLNSCQCAVEGEDVAFSDIISSPPTDLEIIDQTSHSFLSRFKRLRLKHVFVARGIAKSGEAPSPKDSRRTASCRAALLAVLFIGDCWDTLDEDDRVMWVTDSPEDYKIALNALKHSSDSNWGRVEVDGEDPPVGDTVQFAHVSLRGKEIGKEIHVDLALTPNRGVEGVEEAYSHAVTSGGKKLKAAVHSGAAIGRGSQSAVGDVVVVRNAWKAAGRRATDSEPAPVSSYDFVCGMGGRALPAAWKRAQALVPKVLRA